MATHDNFVGERVVQVIPLEPPKSEESGAMEDDELVRLRPESVNPNNVRVGMEDFQALKLIGKGAYGTVRLVRKLNGNDAGRRYAMKSIQKSGVVICASSVVRSKAERDVLASVRSPFICDLVYAFQTNGKLVLIFEFLQGGDLFTELQRRNVLPQKDAVFYTTEVFIAVEHLHRCGVLHRDLKPENVMIDASGHLKLTDFGLCKPDIGQDSRTNSYCGSATHMAPEVILKRPYGYSADWWSFGIMLYDMLVGKTPFYATTPLETKRNVLCQALKLPPFLSAEAQDFLTRLLRKKVEDRLGSGPSGSNAIKSHAIFSNINWHDAYARKMQPPMIPTLQDVFSPSLQQYSPNTNNVFAGFTYTAPTAATEVGNTIVENDGLELMNNGQDDVIQYFG
ncbi:unnamed protein product [Caenorhabditis sp. 36 PRJEB53466]|nr:unnamed protein product [Caenorhabditis sp. 36 PRJEB53466]